MKIPKLTQQQQVYICHALDCIRDNTIATNSPDSRAWYWGKREQFIKRHKATEAMLEQWLIELGRDSMGLPNPRISPSQQLPR